MALMAPKTTKKRKKTAEIKPKKKTSWLRRTFGMAKSTAPSALGAQNAIRKNKKKKKSILDQMPK